MYQKSVKDERRVVVTGLGVISSLGIGWQEFWKNLIAGKSGISKISAFDTSSYDRHFAGEVKNFDAKDFMSKRKAGVLGRASQMVIAASKLALKDGNLNLEKIDKDKMAVYVGTTTGEIQLLERHGDYKFKESGNFNVNSIFVFPSSSLSSNIALMLKLTNQNCVFSTACASGNYAIGKAFDQIKSSKSDYALVGGTDAFSRIVFTGFGRLYAIAPEKCQPFDKNRKGMIPGEGSGMVLLETLASAKKRGAPIYAEVLGYGLSCDAHHMTKPSVKGVSKAMQKALEGSGIIPDEVDYISTHGTGTKENDAAECAAIHKVFNGRSKQIPASSIKSMLGHTMGAASAFEAITCCLAIKNGEVPPTINHEQDDAKCDIDCVPNKSRKHRVGVALNNSQAFGGNNACIILKEIGQF